MLLAFLASGGERALTTMYGFRENLKMLIIYLKNKA
jgi:hypothetical protein